MQLLPVVSTPPLWNLLEWIIQPLTFLERNAARYGDCFSVSLGNYPPFHFVSHPEAVEQIFTAGADQFESGRANSSILQRTLGDNSLLLLDGARHKRHRQLLMPPFHGERMRAYEALIIQLTQSLTQSWKTEQSFSVRPMMQKISLQIILEAVFGLTEGERCRQLQEALQEMLDLTTSRIGFAGNFFPILQKDLGAWSPGARFIKVMQQINRLLYAEIDERRQSFDSDRSDILTLLLSARDEAGQPMSNEELRDELMTLLVAGHETTATALSWALYWVHLLPEVKQTLLAELDNVTDSSAITKLPYLNAVCCETLRIYPVGFITQLRITQSSFQMLDYEFPPESYLIPCIYLIHQRPDLYPEPKRFKPERFLERQFSPYEFLPFGGSNRRCIGAAFALFEMKLVLATVLRQYELSLAEPRPVIPIRRGVTIAPKSGVKLRFVAERPNLIKTVEQVKKG
jgi:unspecific monooxygenase